MFDPTGQGLDDIAEGRIVFVGDPETRIREDYLRILRFFRFHARYGRGAPDAEGLSACAAQSEGMTRLSAERVSKELLKLLAAPDPLPTAAAMAETGVLARVLPEARADGMFAAVAGQSDDPVLRLAALLPVDPVVVADAATRLRLANAVRDRLVAAAAGPVDPTMDDAAARRLIYREGRQAFLDRLVLSPKRDQADAARGLRDLAAGWTVPRMPVGGRELARLGVPAGPETGRLLKAFEDGWVADDFPSDGHEARLAALVADAIRAPRG